MEESKIWVVPSIPNPLTLPLGFPLPFSSDSLEALTNTTCSSEPPGDQSEKLMWPHLGLLLSWVFWRSDSATSHEGQGTEGRDRLGSFAPYHDA